MKTNKLYIIGNGFDLAHDLRTSYTDFYDWLRGTSYQVDNKNDYSEFVTQMDEIFAYANDGDPIEWWSDFENALGNLQIDEYIENVANEYNEDDPSSLSEQVSAHVDYIAKPLGLDEIQTKFSEWVKKIPVYEDMEPCFTDEDIDKDGLFLTFNYTDTLEKVYKINPSNILHIHGQASDSDTEIVVGHITQYDTRDYAETEEKLFGVDSDGIFPLLVDTMNGLRKPVKKLIEQNKDWFKQLQEQNVKEIYLYGLSFGEIDDDYFREIHKLLPDASWIFAIHANGERTQKRRVRRINEFIKRIGIDKTKCSAFDQDSIYNNQIEL